MNDQTLLCLAGGALLIWWITTGSSQSESLDSDVAKLESIAQWWLDNGLFENLSSYVAYNMEVFLEETDKWRNLNREQLAKLTKRELMDLANDLPEILKLINKMEPVGVRFLRTILTQGFVKDNALQVPFERKDDVARFCKLAKQALQKTATIVQQVFQKLPGESKQDFTDKLQ